MPAPESITIQGRDVRVRGGDGGEQQGEAGRFVDALQQASVRGFDEVPLPHNVAWKVDAGPLTVCILELEPALRHMDVVAADSPLSYGPGATYAPRRLATPFIVLKVPLLKGMIIPRCELFYRIEIGMWEDHWCVDPEGTLPKVPKRFKDRHEQARARRARSQI